MGQVAPKVIECFRAAAGSTYDDYLGFHDVQAHDSAAVNDAALVDTVIPLTGLVERSTAASTSPTSGAARATRSTSWDAFPAAGSPGSTSAPRPSPPPAPRRRVGPRNVTFELRDVVTLPIASFDLVTAFDAIHDQAHPAAVLASIRAALRPDGTFLMVDINASSNLEDNADLPWGSFLYAISTLHCMTVSLGQGGDGLGTVWGVQLAERMLRDAGFGDVVRHDVEADPFNAYVVARP